MWDVREPQVWQKAHRLTREPKRESRGTVEVRAGTAWPPECNDHDDLHARTGPWGGGGKASDGSPDGADWRAGGDRRICLSRAR